MTGLRRGRSLGAILCAWLILAAGPPPVAMQVAGNGPVVVFESGAGVAQDTWRQVVPALMPCLTTVTYDRPGIGGTAAAAEIAGTIPSVASIQAGPKLPPVPLVVLAATDHASPPDYEALWQDVQRRTSLLSPKGKLVVVKSGHYIQLDRPDAVIDAV